MYINNLQTSGGGGVIHKNGSVDSIHFALWQ